jgi:anti-sigma B factor antagonist
MPSQLNVKQETRSNFLLVKVEGHLTARHILSARATFNQALQEHGNIAMDLSGIQFLDSMGVGILVNLFKQMKKKGGRLIILNPSQVAKEIFEVSDMDKWLPIHEDGADFDALFR